MWRRTLRLCALLVVASGATAGAQTIELEWFSIDAGAAALAGGSITAGVTAGQPDVTPIALNGGSLEFVGGYWSDPATPAGPQPPLILGWSSVRLHAGSQYKMVLDPAAGAAVSETRIAGVKRKDSGILMISVSFSQPVQAADGQLDPGDVLVQNHKGKEFTPNGVALQNGDTELLVGFKPGALPNQARYTIDLTGRFQNAAGQLLAGDATCDVRGLLADVDSSGLVDIVDAELLHAQIGQSVTGETARFDLDTSGAITWIDFLALIVFAGTSAP